MSYNITLINEPSEDGLFYLNVIVVMTEIMTRATDLQVQCVYSNDRINVYKRQHKVNAKGINRRLKAYNRHKDKV